MMYIAEPLSYFRNHAQQEQAGINVVLLSRIEWFEIATEAYEEGYFIESLSEYKISLINLLRDSVGLSKIYNRTKN
uniref:CAZy families GT2 protein n=1 Tax=uncultured Bacillus sp. TaxID=83428 RepID=A0A060CNH0_9BACI|nr:CAZy families GT2 protein [uncultured Bacillus sp.]